MRISTNPNLERKFWVEKLNLFGFKKLANEIESRCVSEIRPKLKPYIKRLLACKYWTLIERLVIMSWIDGQVDYRKL